MPTVSEFADKSLVKTSEVSERSEGEGAEIGVATAFNPASSFKKNKLTPVMAVRVRNKKTRSSFFIPSIKITI